MSGVHAIQNFNKNSQLLTDTRMDSATTTESRKEKYMQTFLQASSRN